MTNTEVSSDATSGTQTDLGADMALEVVTLPVSDVDRSKRFYQSLGWRLDADIVASDEVRVVQLYPGGNGRTDVSVASLADLLHETSVHHGSFEAVAPPHDWWDWYAAYMDARQQGSTEEQAVAAAGRYMADVKHVVAPT